MMQSTLSLGPLQWTIAVLGALMVGAAKSGIAGLSLLFVAAFALVIPSAKQVSGMVLPLLILGDWIAVYAYRRHLQWTHLGRLIPWTATGVVAGYVALGRMSEHATRIVIGVIIVSMAALGYWQRFRSRGVEAAAPAPALRHWSVAALLGISAGFATLVANAAGPLMAIYLLAMRLPKMEYVGTAAVFFALLNLFKLPFMINLGLVNRDSLGFNLWLAPAVFAGSWCGRWLVRNINQRIFEELVLAMSAIAGLMLLV